MLNMPDVVSVDSRIFTCKPSEFSHRIVRIYFESNAIQYPHNFRRAHWKGGKWPERKQCGCAFHFFIEQYNYTTRCLNLLYLRAA